MPCANIFIRLEIFIRLNICIHCRGGAEHLVEYIPRENAGEGFGVAFFPILEILGQTPVEEITFPSSLTLETELCAALRAAVPTSSIAAADFTTTWDGDNCPPITGTILHQWPNCGKEVKQKKAGNKGNNTNCIKFIIS